ncbi:UNVERIFIED_CONTAM: hypothetical protein K2H54_033489, partial [Gekko kuhli]
LPLTCPMVMEMLGWAAGPAPKTLRWVTPAPYTLYWPPPPTPADALASRGAGSHASSADGGADSHAGLAGGHGCTGPASVHGARPAGLSGGHTDTDNGPADRGHGQQSAHPASRSGSDGSPGLGGADGRSSRVAVWSQYGPELPLPTLPLFSCPF